MESRGASSVFWGAGLPLAVFQHPGLVVLGNGLFAGLANISGRFGLTPLPAQLFKAQPLAVLAMRARHEVAALIRSWMAGLSSISASIRCFEARLAISTVGHTAIMGPGAW